MSLDPLYEGYEEKWVLDVVRAGFVHGKFFTVVPEVAKYRPSESVDTWHQRNKKVARVFEVYFKGMFVCDVDTSMPKQHIVNKVDRILQNKLEKKKAEEVKQNEDTSSTTTH